MIFLQRRTLVLFIVQVAYACGDQGMQCNSDQGSSAPASTDRSLLQTQQLASKTVVDESKSSRAIHEKKTGSVAASAPSPQANGKAQKGTGNKDLKSSAHHQKDEKMEYNLEVQAKRNANADAEIDDEDDGEGDEDNSGDDDYSGDDEGWVFGDSFVEQGHVFDGDGDSQNANASNTQDAEEDNGGRDEDAENEDAGEGAGNSDLSQEDSKLSQEFHQVDDPSLVAKLTLKDVVGKITVAEGKAETASEQVARLEGHLESARDKEQSTANAVADLYQQRDRLVVDKWQKMVDDQRQQLDALSNQQHSLEEEIQAANKSLAGRSVAPVPTDAPAVAREDDPKQHERAAHAAKAELSLLVSTQK